VKSSGNSRPPATKPGQVEHKAHRVMSDTGYSAWVQFDNGEVYIVNGIVDDASKEEIRGDALRISEFILEANEEGGQPSSARDGVRAPRIRCVTKG